MQQTSKNKIVSIIVLYNINLEDSSTYITLKAAIAALPSSRSIDIVVYDNSVVSHIQISNLPTDITYIHDAENGGISKAYNIALDLARLRGCDWLLLLDQDSELSLDFIHNCWSDLQLQQDNPSIAAIVPTVYCDSTLISPCRVGWGGKVYPILVNSMRVPPYEITAINSGALVNVAFLNDIGGFNNEFWLDMLDHWLFRSIHNNRMAVIVGNNTLFHNLSIHNYSTISFARYQNIISAESHFNASNCSVVQRVAFKIRLVIRVLKFIFIHKRADLSWLTFCYIHKR